MLLRLKIKNFLSFYGETEFDMFPNIKREKFRHHILDGEVPLLKLAAVYGANGSGKSNFVKAVDFLHNFVTDDIYLEKIDPDNYYFQLTREKSQTISFETEFFHGGKYYLYSVDIGKEELSEKLFLSGLGKVENERIFERKGTSVHSPYLQNEAAVRQLLMSNPKSSLLPLNSRFPVLSGMDSKNAYEWFSSQLQIITVNSKLPTLIGLMSQQPELLKFANEVFENTGIGIRSLEISNEPFEKWISNNRNAAEIQHVLDRNITAGFISKMEDSRNVFNISVQNGIKMAQEFLFDQLGQSGYHKAMKISAQSDGTVRLLMLIPAMYAALHGRKVIVIDEIDHCLHPNLLYELLRFYAGSKPCGQLIFTTHTTLLLNQQELVRPDEVWLTEKSEGNTRMYSLNDFKLHNTLNLENGYLDGRYGAVPVIGELNETDDAD